MRRLVGVSSFAVTLQVPIRISRVLMLSSGSNSIYDGIPSSSGDRPAITGSEVELHLRKRNPPFEADRLIPHAVGWLFRYSGNGGLGLGGRLNHVLHK